MLCCELDLEHKDIDDIDSHLNDTKIPTRNIFGHKTDHGDKQIVILNMIRSHGDFLSLRIHSTKYQLC